MDERIRQAILQVGKEHDNFYLYDEQGIKDSAERLKGAFPDVEFLYSVKCNPHKKVLSTVFSSGLGADAASAGEVKLSAELGLGKDKIYYSAPGKTMKDIESTIDDCMIIADSLSELGRIQAAAEKKGITAEVGMRINPDFSFTGDRGVSSKFGIDMADALAFIDNNNCPNVKVTGIHVHIRSQELCPKALESYYKKMLKLAECFRQKLGRLDYVNLGSGIGVAYALRDKPLDVAELGGRVRQEIKKFCENNRDTKLIIETGRYMICKSGFYVTKVLDKKTSHGKTYVILQNTLNGFIRPSVAQMVLKYTDSESPMGWEPLYTGKDAFEFITLKESGEKEKVELVGNLCTATDLIASDIELPVLNEGDIFVITNAGAYAAVLSPMQFASQVHPEELFFSVGKIQ